MTFELPAGNSGSGSGVGVTGSSVTGGVFGSVSSVVSNDIADDDELLRLAAISFPADTVCGLTVIISTTRI